MDSATPGGDSLGHNHDSTFDPSLDAGDPSLGAGSNPFDFSGQGGGLDGLGLDDGLGTLLGLGDAGLPGDPGILEKNLIALCARNRELAHRVASSSPRAGVVFEHASDGAVSGTIDWRRLGSKRRVLDEARALADSIDPAECAAACVVGFGLGHHAAMLQERLGGKSLIIVFEPDVALLRAVFERVDHSAWLALGRCVFVTEAGDPAGLTRKIEGFEGIVSLGAKIIEHSPSRARIGADANVFGKTMSDVVRSTRTSIVTTLVHAPVTLRNMTMNADRYAACAGIAGLKDSCAGRAGVVVAAGPSLAKNLALLGEPGVRERVVIIAAQTVLKPMLAAGIKPHFVTALDHHELSGRFYEGLTSEDVEGVRLVVEPKANASIFEKFPGEILCIGEEVLDLLIGDALVRPMDALPSGATVAHLSYYLARYLGCDPVIMIGQDLGFTDGQYYAAGAAIHRVWQGELNHDRSLEMLEWERVARMRANLHKVSGQDGRAIYADEQMVTYLAQFEADFQRDTQRGLTIVDATEGGAAKRYTHVMALRDALDRFGGGDPISLPITSGGARSIDKVRGALREHWVRLIEQAREIKAASTETASSLKKIADRRVDQSEANRIVVGVQKTGERVRSITPGFRLVEFINQTGVLNRYKADRLIGLANEQDSAERQRLQAERDVKNVEWIGAAAEELARQIKLAIEVLDGARDKLTRDRADQGESGSGSEKVSIGAEPLAVEVVVLCDPDRSGLGTARDLGEKVWRGQSALELTLRRALAVRAARGVRLLTPNESRTRELVEQAGLRDRVTIEAVDAARWRARARAIGLARASASDAWRGGIGQTTVFDEQLCPEILGEVMERRGIDAAVLIGCDWALADPALLDAAINRHREQPERHQITFAQAAPGLGGCVLGRDAIKALRELRSIGSPLGTVGGLLGYVPVRTQADPIGTALCVSVDPAARDLGVRAIADTALGREIVASAMDRLGERATDSSATQSARAIAAGHTRGMPRTLILDLGSARIGGGVLGAWKRGRAGPISRPKLKLARAHSLLRAHALARGDSVLRLDGPGDPLVHEDALDFVRLGEELGVACVHLRTDFLGPDVSPESIIDSGVGVVSVDLLTTDAPTYAALTSMDAHGLVMDRIGSLADARVLDASGLRLPWILPRMTKCDAVLEQMESFYDAWIMMMGSATIDPLPGWSSDRIRPLPVPTGRAAQIEGDTLRVRSDGAVCDNAWCPLVGVNAFDDGLDAAVQAWRTSVAGDEVAADMVGAPAGSAA